MVKKLILFFSSCFFVCSHGSYDPKYDHCACQGYSLEEPVEPGQIITVYSIGPYEALKLVLRRLGERIQTVIAKKTTKRVANDMVLIVKQFMLKFENCVIPDFRKKAFVLHDELAEETTKIVASFSSNRPDIIAQLTELVWKRMREVFDESVHRQLANYLHQCITNYFIRQPREIINEKKETSTVMIASVAKPQQVQSIQTPTHSVCEEKKEIIMSEHKEAAQPVANQASVLHASEPSVIPQAESRKEEKKAEAKAAPAARPTLTTVVVDTAQPQKKKRKKPNVFDRLTAPIALDIASKNTVKKKLSARLIVNNGYRPRWRF